MALFQELEIETYTTAGEIKSVIAGSLAEEVGILPGDLLLAVNEQPVQDIIDVQFYAAEEYIDLLIQRGEERIIFDIEREYGEELGLEFTHPTFDTDIRRCNNLCEFCFVLQMAPKFRRTLYIKDDDYRYSFLFGHFVTLTNLNEHDWWRIETMGLSPLYISVHVTDWEKRKLFLRNKNAPDIMEQLRWLAERDVEIHTQLVIVPEFNDGAWLERSIRELAELWPTVRSVSVVPVGLTAHHKYKMRSHTAAEAKATLAYVNELQTIYQEKFGVRFVYPTDEWFLVSGETVPPLEAYDDQALHENGLGMVRHFLDEWVTVQEEIREKERQEKKRDADRSEENIGLFPNRHLTLGTAALFHDTLQKICAEFAQLTGVSLDLYLLKNFRFGDGITVAGLLMAEDVILQLKQIEQLGDVVVLPRIMFDHPETVSLDDVTPAEVAYRIDRPIALVDTMGDVWDLLIGESRTVYTPEMGREEKR